MPDSSNSGTIMSGIVALLVAILLVVTNPTEDAHREAIADEFGRERPLAGAIGLGAVTAEMPKYHSFVLGSYSTEATREGEAVFSIGLLGFVQVLVEKPR
jgi:hypothetical protein